MRRSHIPSPVLGLLLGIGVLFLIGILLIYGGQQRIAEELARVAEAQGLSSQKPPPAGGAPCPAPKKQPARSGGPPASGSFFGNIKRPQPTVNGSTIYFEPTTQK